MPINRDMRSNRSVTVFTLTLVLVLVAASSSSVSAWSNGGYSADPTHPDYGTHDWIAQHALDWLPTEEKQFFVDNMADFLYGTELPDNRNTPGGVGDTTRHHVYFYLNGSMQDDASAVRASQEYAAAVEAWGEGNLSAAAMHLGMVTHYISDMAVFGHVMGAATEWGTETHHSDYENHVLSRTDSYVCGEFEDYLVFDGSLTSGSAYDAAVAVAQETVFDDSSEGYTCMWMDANYDWGSPVFVSRCGESLSLATNAVTDVLHTFYLVTVTPSVTATQTPTEAASPTPKQTATPTASPTLTQSPAPSPSVPEFPETTAIVLIVLTCTLASAVWFRKKSFQNKPD